MGHDVLLSPFASAQPTGSPVETRSRSRTQGQAQGRATPPLPPKRLWFNLASSSSSPVTYRRYFFICYRRREFCRSVAVVSQKTTRSISLMERAEAAA